jgi:hypothetical protein
VGVLPNEHLSQFDKVTVFFVVYFDYSPGVFPCPDDPAITGLDGRVGTNDCKRHFGHDLSVFRDCFVVIESVTRGFKDLNLVMFNITQHSLLERDDFITSKRIGFGDDGDQVDLKSEMDTRGERDL